MMIRTETPCIFDAWGGPFIKINLVFYSFFFPAVYIHMV